MKTQISLGYTKRFYSFPSTKFIMLKVKQHLYICWKWIFYYITCILFYIFFITWNVQ